MNHFTQTHAPVKTEKPLAERIITAVEQHLLSTSGEVHGSLKEIADEFSLAHNGVGIAENPMMLDFLCELGLQFFCCGTHLRCAKSQAGVISLWHAHFSEH